MTTLSPPRPTRVDPVIGRAVRDTLPVVLAYAPFGLALGATLAATHLPSWIAWASSPLLFGGAAQLLAVQMLDAGAGAVLVVLGALVVNARMLLYSAALAPHTADWRARWRWLAAYFMADPVYALAITRFTGTDTDDPRARLRYFFTVGLVMWPAWLGLTGAGVLLGGVLPPSLRLDLAAPLTFLLLMLPMLTSRPACAAAVTGGTVAVAASGLPLGLGLLAGAAAGIAVGGWWGGRRA
jgi:predicted branched-subunit amino acid permease